MADTECRRRWCSGRQAQPPEPRTDPRRIGPQLADTQDANRGGGEARAGRAARGSGGEDLEGSVKKWPTAAATDWKSSARGGATEGSVVGGERSELPTWPPGPDDLDGWRRVITARPDLAPAIPRGTRRAKPANQPPAEPQLDHMAGETGSGGGGAQEAQPSIRVLAPKLSGGVDRNCSSRTDRLRALGNAVVPAQAEYAIRELARRIVGGGRK